MKSRNQSYIIYLLLFIAIVAMVYFNVRHQPNSQGPLTISQVAQQIQAGTISRIVVRDDNSLQVVIFRNGSAAIEQIARKEPETTLVSQLLALGVSPEKLAKVAIEVNSPQPVGRHPEFPWQHHPAGDPARGPVLVHFPPGAGQQ